MKLASTTASKGGLIRRTIGYTGPGNISEPMAANLLLAGFSVRIWNRSPERAEPLVARGAVSLSLPEESAEPRSLLVSSGMWRLRRIAFALYTCPEESDLIAGLKIRRKKGR